MPLDILALPGLRAVETWDRSSSGRMTTVIVADPTSAPQACPVCDGVLRQHGVRLIEAKDALPHGEFIEMVRNDLPFQEDVAQRLMKIARDPKLANTAHARLLPASWMTLYELTKIDDKTFAAAVEQGRIRPDMTRRLVRFIGMAALRKRAFADVAAETGVDTRTVREIFDDQVKQLEEWFPPLAPRWLGIDEVHVAGKIPAVLTDVETKQLIDILPSRSQESIVAAIDALEGCERIEAVAMDLCWPYRNAVAEILPAVPVVIDKRHALELARRAMEKVRRVIWRRGRRRRRIGRADVALLNRRRFDLSDAETATVAAWCEVFPNLGRAYELKEGFYAIWDLRDRAEAEARFAAWRASIPADLAEIFGPVAATMDAWRDEVFGYFDFAGQVTNAFTETANGLIKEIQGIGRGYSFDRLRAKALHLYGRWTEEELRIREAALGLRMAPASRGISEAELAVVLARRGLQLEPGARLGHAGILVSEPQFPGEIFERQESDGNWKNGGVLRPASRLTADCRSAVSKSKIPPRNRFPRIAETCPEDPIRPNSKRGR